MTPNPKKQFPPQPNKNIYDGNEELDYDWEQLEQREDEVDEEAEMDARKYNKMIDEENSD